MSSDGGAEGKGEGIFSVPDIFCFFKKPGKKPEVHRNEVISPRF